MIAPLNLSALISFEACPTTCTVAPLATHVSRGNAGGNILQVSPGTESVARDNTDYRRVGLVQMSAIKIGAHLRIGAKRTSIEKGRPPKRAPRMRNRAYWCYIFFEHFLAVSSHTPSALSSYECTRCL